MRIIIALTITAWLITMSIALANTEIAIREFPYQYIMSIPDGQGMQTLMVEGQ